MVIFKRMVVKNLGPFENLTYDWDKFSGLLTGINKEAGLHRNGTGKSMLPDCLTWILWDKTVRKAEKATLIRDNQDFGEGEIIFETDDGIFKVIRKRTQKKLSLSVYKYTNEKFIRIPTKLNQQAQNRINNLLGFNFDNFINVSYIGQNTTNSFVDGKPTERESIIANFFKLTEIDSATEISKKHYKEFKESFSTNNAKMEAWKEIIDNVDFKVLSKNRSLLYKKKVMLEEKLVKTNKLLATADYFVKVLATRETRQLQLESNLALKEQKISQYKEQRIVAEEDNNRMKVLKVQKKSVMNHKMRLKHLTKKIDELQDEANSISREMRGYSGRIIATKERLKEAQQIIGFKELECPTCHQKISDEHLIKITDQINKYKKTLNSYLLAYEEDKVAIEELEDEIDNYKSKLITLKSKVQSKDYVDAEMKIILKRREKREVSKKELAKFIKMIDKENKKLRALIAQADKEPIPNGFGHGHIEKIRLKIIELEKNVERIIAETEKIKLKLKEYRAAERKIADFNDRQVGLSEKMSIYSYLIDVFKQVKLAFIDDINDQLEDVINKNLRSMGSKIRVELVTEATKKTDGVSIDRYDILIISDGKKRPWETYSGGEKQRISLSIYFAFNELIRTKFGIDVNVIIFDEIFMSMDDVGRDIFLNMIKEIEKDKNVLIITHIEEIISEFPLNKRLYFIKSEDGISRTKRR